ncbi:MAG: sulfite exporter TauE/SafE family protein [Tumebacillaceae bacterium]
MSVCLIVTLFFIGLIGSFLSGMLGVGGAIINYPMVLFIPPMLGVGSFTAHEVSGMIAVQVLFATLSGVLALRREKLINYRLVAFMGTSIVVGSFIGGFGSQLLSSSTVNFVYAFLATVAAVMMFIPKKGVLNAPTEEVQFNRLLAVICALIVGTASGIVGAGGAFILVPIMLLFLKIPIRMTIASSLAITFLSSIGSVGGKLLADHILIGPTIVIVIASIVAAPIGTVVSKKTNPRMLQAVMSVLILVTTLKIWSDILWE